MSNERQYTKYGEWNDRIEMLGYDIMALISEGKTEPVNDIIKHFENSDVVHYLMGKYKDNMFLINENCPYNLEDWEKVFEQYAYLTFGHDVRRKMGLINEETDGLLLVLNVILQEVSERRYE